MPLSLGLPASFIGVSDLPSLVAPTSGEKHFSSRPASADPTSPHGCSTHRSATTKSDDRAVLPTPPPRHCRRLSSAYSCASASSYASSSLPPHQSAISSRVPKEGDGRRGESEGVSLSNEQSSPSHTLWDEQGAINNLMIQLELAREETRCAAAGSSTLAAELEEALQLGAELEAQLAHSNRELQIERDKVREAILDKEHLTKNNAASHEALKVALDKLQKVTNNLANTKDELHEANIKLDRYSCSSELPVQYQTVLAENEKMARELEVYRQKMEAALQEISQEQRGSVELLEQQAVASDDVGCSDYRRMILDKLAESNQELEIERDKARKCVLETKQVIKNHQKSDAALKILVDKHEETVYMLEKMSSEKERLKNELWVCQKKDETARADFEEQIQVAEMSLNAANIRCSDLEWQLEAVRARLLTSSQNGDRLQMQCATLEHRLQEQQLAFSLDKGKAEQRVADLERQLEDIEGQLQEVCKSSAFAKQEKEELKMKVSKIEKELAGAVFVHGIVEEQVRSMLEAEMALSDAKVRCSDLERQLENVTAELEMRWLKTSQDCELEKQEKKELTSKLLEIEEELVRTKEHLEDVSAEVLKSAQDCESLQKQWLKTLQDGELEKQEKRELKREVKFKLSEMEKELTRILEEMQTANKLQIECQSRFEKELHEQKQEQSRMQVCLGEMQLELDKTYQEKKELEKQREQRDEMTSESNAKLMNFQKQLDAMKKDLEESQEAKRLLKEQLDEIQLMGLEETCGQYLREKQELGTQLDEVASNLARKEQELMYAEKERDEKAEIAGRVETLSQRLVEVVKSGKKVEEELQEVQHSLANNVMQREAAQTELQTNKTVMTAFRSVFNYTDYTIQRLLHDLDAMKEVLDESYEFEKSIVSSIEETENEKQAARAAVAAEYSLLLL